MYSGQILGAVVDALNVGEGVLAGKTAKRMFSGRSVSEYSRKEVLEAVGQAMVDLGLVPDVDEKLREPPFRDGLTTSDILADVIGMMCVQWDMLMRHMQNRGAAVTDFSGAGREFLRLATVDIALRMVGFAHFAALELPNPHVPVWAQPNGAGEIMRIHQRRVGLSRHQLAINLEVSRTTVDNWLDGRNTPGRSYLPALAMWLSRGQSVSADDLEAELRRQFALARLAEAVASAVGWDAVSADVEAAFRFSKLMEESNALTSFFELLAEVKELADLDIVDNPERLGDFLLPMLLLLGSTAPFARVLLRQLAERPEARAWLEDIYAVASSPEMQFELIAFRHSGERQYLGLSQDYLDVVTEPSPQDLEARAAIKRLEIGELDALLPFGPVMDSASDAFEMYMGMPGPLRDLVQRFSASAEAHYHLGSLLSLMGVRLGNRALVDEGIMECMVSSGLEPRWDAPAVAPSVTLCNLDDWDGALRELEKAARVLPEVTPHLQLVRAYALMNSGRHEQALADYLVLTKTRPDFAAVWEGTARCAFALGNNTSGLGFAKRARALGEPSVYDAWAKGAFGPKRKHSAI